ncbi:MAG: hypothetical protein Q7J65_02105 [Candidatus Marinimicrobia bacterium]|nr:hypothetical protein [Candidatus Neomarinimicrobiota bacterium]
MQNLAKYRKIVTAMPKQWAPMLMSQYSAFRLFKQNGFALKYLNHHEIKIRSEEELVYLHFQIVNPWRFTYCSVIDRPAPRCFNMRDILSGETFLLFSPGIADSLEKLGSVQMFFLLIGFNGQCWQTYGPLAHLIGIIPADILFFAQQINKNAGKLSDLPEMLDRDPFPFMMLFKGGEIPLTFHDADMIVLNSSEFYDEHFDPEQYADSFKLTKKYPLYKLSLKYWGEFPHFAACYYHSEKHRLILTAMTDRGYEKIIHTYRKAAYHLAPDPQHRVTINMAHLIKEILRKDVILNPYEKTFEEPDPPDS